MREDASGRRQRAVMATDAEWERIGRAAAESGMDLSRFVIHRALDWDPLPPEVLRRVSTAAGICTGAAAQKCTTGLVVACPRSPWEGATRGATRPPRGWRRPARGRMEWTPPTPDAGGREG